MTAEAAYLTAPMPAESLPWRDATYSVIDLETTGLDPAGDEILSYASVTVEGGRIRLDDARYGLVRPRRMPSGETIRIHGLRPSDLADAAPLSAVLDELLEALMRRVLVAHVAGIEAGFLSAALERSGLPFRNRVVDTAGLALELERRRGRRHPRHPLGLSDLARGMNLPVHRPHHADGDALTTAQVFLALASHLEELEPITVGSLERLSRATQAPTPALPVRAWRRLRAPRLGR